MGEAKRRAPEKDRIAKARAHQEAIQNRIAKFSREVGLFGKKTGLDLGAVKLDARFVIMKFDDLLKFVDRLPVTDVEILEELERRQADKPERAPKVAWWRRLLGRIKHGK